MTALHTSDLTLTWPDGTPAVTGLDLGLGPGRHGLVGDNGSGKSTLLRLLAGELVAERGSVTVDGRLGYVAQAPLPDAGGTVGDALGVGPALRALAAIEAGSVEVADFDAVGEDWDVAERAEAALGRLGLHRLEPGRPLAEVSGGELSLLRLAGVLLHRPDVLLLDEPSNDLDGAGRERLTDLVRGWPGLLLLASHDRVLLEEVDDVGELRRDRHGATSLRWYGGGWSAYVAAVEAEQDAARQAATTAAADLRRERRDLVRARTALAGRARTAAKAEREKRVPKIVAHGRRMQAQESAGRYRGLHEDRVEAARERADAAEERVREDAVVELDLPATRVPERREVARLEALVPAYGDAAPLDLVLRGPERVALSGPNGIGKTSVLRALTGELPPRSGTARVHVPWRMLDQTRSGVLDPALSVAANARLAAPGTEEERLRGSLARFGFRGRAAERTAAVLSGGERLRATLACLLLGEPAPQLLLLDEPTNDLDVSGVRRLVEALASYEGALLVVSHDEAFLADLDLHRRVEVRRPQPS
ncbi:hypothetical protein LUZ63_021773 [Rhynchospora breviuscula]|uniref:ABC transporter domain-containing protein n=1 Tax=Rhynchospora breviuscula TaxID=2022672 RepID=A0A9P9Z6J4_9POAL|nr:hypothetical protein LUZ63_021773 [Rhynchospora breviuscula]